MIKGVDLDYVYQLLVNLDPRSRITGISQYVSRVKVNNLTDRVPLEGYEPTTCPPVDITEGRFREILGEGGDLVAGIASAREKLRIATAERDAKGELAERQAETIEQMKATAAAMSTDLAQARADLNSAREVEKSNRSQLRSQERSLQRMTDKLKELGIDPADFTVEVDEADDADEAQPA